MQSNSDLPEAEHSSNGDRTPLERRLTVSDAALELGLSAEAVRSRVKRGTLRSAKAEGTVYVLLTGDQTGPASDQASSSHARTNDEESTKHDRADDRTEAREELVESLQDQVAYMRDQLAEEREARRRADMIIAQLSQANTVLAQRVPEIEVPEIEAPEPRDVPETVSETTEVTDIPTDRPDLETGVQRRERSWWRRWFGFE
jgi:hypothetical protein